MGTISSTPMPPLSLTWLKLVPNIAQKLGLVSFLTQSTLPSQSLPKFTKSWEFTTQTKSSESPPWTLSELKLSSPKNPVTTLPTRMSQSSEDTPVSPSSQSSLKQT